MTDPEGHGRSQRAATLLAASLYYYLALKIVVLIAGVLMALKVIGVW